MEQKVRKIGFFAAIGICLGSIVGIGIFLKNDSVGKSLDGNGISWLMTWIISGLIALMVAFHFGKISKVELSQKNASGLSFWTNDIVCEKHSWFKKIVSSNYGFFYNSILVIALCFFTSELLVSFINEIIEIKLEVWHHVLITLGFIVFFVLINFFSIKSSGYISIATTILKFIPLIMVVFIGIIFANTHNFTSNGIQSSNGFKNNISFQKAIQGIMVSIPAVLFAFDSFVGIGTLSTQVKGGYKTVSKVIITSIIVATIIYLLVCVSSILHYNSKDTTVLNVLIDSLPSNAKQGITIFVAFFLFVAAFGTTNGITSAMVQEFKHMIHTQKTPISFYLNKKFGEKKGSLILCFASLMFWSIITYVPSIIMNTDGLIDGFSNLIVIYFFLVYIFLIYQYWRNCYQSKNKKEKIIYSTLVWITIGSVLVVISLNLFFIFFNGISKANESSSWGLYLSGGSYHSLSNLDVLIVYIAITSAFFGFPFLNHLFKKQVKKHN